MTQPLSLGQLSVWHDIRELPPARRHEPNNVALWALSPDTHPDATRRAVAALAARHPSLRTRYDLDNPDAPRQLTPDADFLDELPTIETANTADPHAPLTGPAEPSEPTGLPGPAESPESIARDLAAEPFDLGRQHGWRARLLTRAGVPSHLLFVKHHIAADAWAQETLHREFRQELLAPGRLGPPAAGPAELAAAQYTPAGLRRQRAALAHWARTLERAPAAALPRPAEASGTVVQATLHSVAARAAARALAERAQVSVAGVVLAAYVRAVARRVETGSLLVQLMSANRFVGRWKDVVTSMNQWVPALVDRADGEFPTLAKSAHWSSLAAVRHGMHDVTEVAALKAGAPDAPEPACAFNYVAVPDQPPAAAPAVAPNAEHADERGGFTVTWEEPFTTIGPRCYARVLETGHELSVRLTAKDVGRDQCAALLGDLHDGLLNAARRL
ncbi:Condensation domain-containing protein [Streptomyces sp. yr375]|uniref:condensation domain-containing protein n=1 Tax=Streptomyces sp. yr375 TaxID=1761906 RepID=UPI0008B618B0|nr:condensation domain-containing protein [Streptomyces sp. yr375]SER12949.1 Condensation domain-containing protein [Streptomyces sp. yr375]